MTNLLDDLQVSNTRYLAAATKLKSANRELETFAYSVSHDLRAPLRAISGFSEILNRRYRTSLDKRGQHYLDNVVEASEQMGQLIDDLLTYSRLGRKSIRRQRVSLAELLEQLKNQLGPQLADKQAELTLPALASLPVVAGDWTLLRQIMTNLIINALTYHRPDVPPRIDIECHEVEDAQVTIAVIDNGLGIAPEFHQKIFDMFQRLHHTEHYPGTGIGLSIVRKSVDLLNGEIWVESVEDKGSTFYLKLPLAGPDMPVNGRRPVEIGPE
jgi:signal transduction histidine kinase